MLTYAYVAAGGAIGTLARYQMGLVFAEAFGEAFPWGTVFINVTGSFLIGVLAALTGPGGRWPVSLDLRAFLLVGLCGGYTTFSSFSLQTLALLQSGYPARALVNVAASVLLCLLAVWAGFAAPAAFASRA